MKMLSFTLIVIAGTVIGAVTASAGLTQSAYGRAKAIAVQQGAIAGAVGGIIVAGIGLWLTGDKKKPD